MFAIRLRSLFLGGALLATTMAIANDPSDVIWTTPSENAAGSMPLGNGSLGINLWAEKDGSVSLYVSHTDAWSEVNRLLKLAKVRLTFNPPLDPAKGFEHRLVVREGRATLRIDDWNLEVFVDAELSVIWLSGSGKSKRIVSVEPITLRPKRKQLAGDELNSSWTMRGSPNPVWEEADQVFLRDFQQYVVHHNTSSIVPLTWQHQGLPDLAKLQPDPLLNRAFGIKAPMVFPSARTEFQIPVVAHVAQVPNVEAWQRQIDKIKPEFPKARERTTAWWRAFWQRSWIEVDAASKLEIPRNNHEIRIGFDSNGQNRFQGDLRLAMIWNRALPESVIATHAKTWGSIGPGDDPGPVMSGSSLGGLQAGKPDFTHGLTVSAWIVPSAEHPIGRIVDKLTAGTSDGFLFDTHPGNALRLIVGSRQFLLEKALTPGKQTHVAATVNPPTGEVVIYRDGKPLKRFGETDLGEQITQSYALQRYVNACGSRGQFPVKFNGSIFTVEPAAMGIAFNADWRRWGGDYWYQNTRLPYAAMVAAGDYDLMDPIFRLYESNLRVCTARAKQYYGAKGVYFPETMTNFGSYSNGDYGWDRNGLEPSNINSPWWQFAWNQGPELLMLMFERYDHTGDASFLKKRLVPMAQAVIDYFDSRFPRKNGRLELTPTQAVETYWHEVVNDTPTIVGLHVVLDQLIRLPNDSLSKSFRDQCKRLKAELVGVPVKDGIILPAERYKDERSNVENPGLYALWPFRWAGVGTGRLELARETFRKRIERSNAGWQYDGQCAAIAGLADDAAQSLTAKVANSNPAYRWPATWGPNYDWLPDQCHGGNIMLTLQNMCLQEAGGKLYVLPAWPKAWNVRFRLKASGNTSVEVDYRGGKLVKVAVTPKGRERDVVTE